MARIKGSGNRTTEQKLAAIFRYQGIKGWRRKQKIFGKPDFVFKPAKIAVFVDGCFWHGCPLHCTMPKNNASFWRQKLNANKIRDQRVNRKLKSHGWKVIRIWEHDLRGDRRNLPIECNNELGKIRQLLSPTLANNKALIQHDLPRH